MCLSIYSKTWIYIPTLHWTLLLSTRLIYQNYINLIWFGIFQWIQGLFWDLFLECDYNKGKWCFKNDDIDQSVYKAFTVLPAVPFFLYFLFLHYTKINMLSCKYILYIKYRCMFLVNLYIVKLPSWQMNLFNAVIVSVKCVICI